MMKLEKIIRSILFIATVSVVGMQGLLAEPPPFDIPPAPPPPPAHGIPGAPPPPPSSPSGMVQNGAINKTELGAMLRAAKRNKLLDFKVPEGFTEDQTIEAIIAKKPLGTPVKAESAPASPHTKKASPPAQNKSQVEMMKELQDKLQRRKSIG
jgi:hypothetical protein